MRSGAERGSSQPDVLVELRSRARTDPWRIFPSTHEDFSLMTTVTEYLDSLAPDRRAVVEAVRATIVEHLPAGYDETVRWGMISYEVPLARFPNTYNGAPLSYLGLASKKNHFALYLMGVYGDAMGEARFRDEWLETGCRLDMGRACVRFRTLDQLPLDVIGREVARITPDALIERHEASRRK
jgi:hypothetical protein